MESFYLDAPSVTELEADTLFYHYLKMAIAFFEVMSPSHEFNTLQFDHLSLEAAQSFFEKLKKAYEEVDIEEI